jgi:hypothetical protein
MKSLVRCARGARFRMVAVAWGLAIAGGFLAIHAYEARPGEAGRTVSRWPEGSRLDPARDRPTLVMAAHPRCPCTRASAAELARLMAARGGGAAAYVLVFVPPGVDATWADTGATRALAAIPGVRVVEDRGGVEAGRFGAVTSGQVALYAPDGRLMFRGGITGARGQEGDNRGRAAVTSLLRGIRPDRSASPVFGCPIF